MNKKWDLAGAILMIIIFLGGFYIYSKIAAPGLNKTPIVLKAPTCSLNFSDYEKLLPDQSVNLVHNLNSYAIKGQFYNSRSIDLIRSGDDEIACGYLYIKAKVDGRALDDKYESIYINPQGLGGHILRSLGVRKDNPNETIVLLPLDAVAYLPNLPYNPDAKDYKITNWIKLLNASQSTNFAIGFSTTDAKGEIEEITLTYKCWNPTTGEETKNCRVGKTPQ